MLRLYLLRHAQAASDFSADDKDRPLTAHGLIQAQSLGKHIKEIKKTLCSSAKRTQMTARALKDVDAPLGNIEYQDALYNAPAGDILNAIQNAPSGNLLVIAHNPGIHLLARSMADKGDEKKLEQLNIFYNPASLSIFDCEIQSWDQLKPQSNTLIDFIAPE